MQGCCGWRGSLDVMSVERRRIPMSTGEIPAADRPVGIIRWEI